MAGADIAGKPVERNSAPSTYLGIGEVAVAVYNPGAERYFVSVSGVTPLIRLHSFSFKAVPMDSVFAVVIQFTCITANRQFHTGDCQAMFHTIKCISSIVPYFLFHSDTEGTRHAVSQWAECRSCLWRLRIYISDFIPIDVIAK